MNALLQEKERLQKKLTDSENVLEFRTPSTFPIEDVSKPMLTMDGFDSPVGTPSAKVTNPFQLIKLKSPTEQFKDIRRLFKDPKSVAVRSEPVLSQEPVGTSTVESLGSVPPSEVVQIAKALTLEVADNVVSGDTTVPPNSTL